MSGRRALLVLAAVAAAAPGPGAGVAHAQEEIFEQGNRLYQEGDWAGAIDAYESVLSAGFEGADLHYNLGNAYFKQGDLGHAILAWERAAARAPADPDIAANLELARSLTTDVVQPLPTFWLVSAVSWWVGLLPRALLIGLVSAGWLAVAVGTVSWILARGSEVRAVARWVAVVGGLVAVLLGTNLAVRELGIGRAERGVVLAEAVPVRSAPAADDNLTLFEVHEGTRVRIDERAGAWAEIVLEDGKVGWVPLDVMGVI